MQTLDEIEDIMSLSSSRVLPFLSRDDRQPEAEAGHPEEEPGHTFPVEPGTHTQVQNSNL